MISFEDKIKNKMSGVEVTPGDHVWKSIKKKQQAKKRAIYLRVSSVAAVFLLLFSGVFMMDEKELRPPIERIDNLEIIDIKEFPLSVETPFELRKEVFKPKMSSGKPKEVVAKVEKTIKTEIRRRKLEDIKLDKIEISALDLPKSRLVLDQNIETDLAISGEELLSLVDEKKYINVLNNKVEISEIGKGINQLFSIDKGLTIAQDWAQNQLKRYGYE
jgi:hypothetical protein